MTFDEIKEKCTPGETILTKGSKDYLYLGFNRKGTLVTDTSNGDLCFVWTENMIKDWTIKQDPKKLYAYVSTGIYAIEGCVMLNINDDLEMDGYKRAPEYDIEYK